MATQLAEQALPLYDLPRNSRVQLVNFSENETYMVEAPTGRRWALRLQRPGYQSENSLASEIAWLVALRKDGVVATPVPVAGLMGNLSRSSCSPMGNCETLFCLNGKTAVIPKWTWICATVSRVWGRLRRKCTCTVRKWQRPNGFERFTWDFETALGEAPRWGHWRDALGMNAARLDLFGRTAELIRERLEDYGRGPDCFGLTHCDLRLANLLLHQGELKVIDFDDCGFGWYMYEAATPLSFYEHLPQVSGLIEQWLEGYRTVRTVTKADEEAIPTFVMMRRLLLVAWVGSHAETDLARCLGASYTDQTAGLCSDYLSRNAP